MSGRLREIREERDSLNLTVKILSKVLYFNSKQTCAPSSSPPVLLSDPPDANANGNNNIRGKRKKKKKSQPPRVDVILETVEIPENEIVDEQRQHSPTEVSIILGKSIVQRVHEPSLSKKVGHRAVVKPFPGATFEDMESYVKPTLTKSPTRIIIHAGTNDLKLRRPHEIADTLVGVAHTTESSSDAELVFYLK